jgi:VanZ family protein
MSSAPFLLPNFLRGASFRWPSFFQAWLPVLLFTCAVALESTAAFGSDHTSAPLHHLFQLLFGSAVSQNWTHIHHLVRKTGHFAGCGMISLVLYRAFRLTLRNTAIRLHSSPASHALAIAATFLIASADEIHQCFLPNRTGCFSDVLLDTAGALALQLTLVLILRAASRPQRQPAQRNLPLAA